MKKPLTVVFEEINANKEVHSNLLLAFQVDKKYTINNL